MKSRDFYIRAKEAFVKTLAAILDPIIQQTHSYRKKADELEAQNDSVYYEQFRLTQSALEETIREAESRTKNAESIARQHASRAREFQDELKQIKPAIIKGVASVAAKQNKYFLITEGASIVGVSPSLARGYKTIRGKSLANLQTDLAFLYGERICDSVSIGNKVYQLNPEKQFTSYGFTIHPLESRGKRNKFIRRALREQHLLDENDIPIPAPIFVRENS